MIRTTDPITEEIKYSEIMQQDLSKIQGGLGVFNLATSQSFEICIKPIYGQYIPQDCWYTLTIVRGDDKPVLINGGGIIYRPTNRNCDTIDNMETGSDKSFFWIATPKSDSGNGGADRDRSDSYKITIQMYKKVTKKCDFGQCDFGQYDFPDEEFDAPCYRSLAYGNQPALGKTVSGGNMSQHHDTHSIPEDVNYEKDGPPIETTIQLVSYSSDEEIKQQNSRYELWKETTKLSTLQRESIQTRTEHAQLTRQLKELSKKMVSDQQKITSQQQKVDSLRKKLGDHTTQEVMLY